MKSIIFCLTTLLFIPFFYSAPFASGEKNFKENELIVKFANGVNKNEKKDLHGKYSSKIIKRFTINDIDHVELAPDVSVDDAIRLYEADPSVESVEPNYIFSVNELMPDDPLFYDQWSLYNFRQTGGTRRADIDAVNAWSIANDSNDYVVAVLDSGIEYTHEDLASNIWVNEAESNGLQGIDDDNNGYIDDIYGIDVYDHDSTPLDELGHGTHVAGIIGAAGNNGIGIAGINWNVKIMNCRFLGPWGTGLLSGAIECLEYIKTMKDRGVNIVATNNSYSSAYYSASHYDAIDAQRDILFFASAGNDSQDNDIYSTYPANYFLPNVISVASTDHNDEKALTSSYGRKTVHVGAPGVNIMSTLPEYTHWGASYYGTLSGTSMAAPHAAALAALLKSQNPERDWIQIKNLILTGGDKLKSLKKITITGRRINAYGSLECNKSSVFSALSYPDPSGVGEPAVLSAISVRCEFPVGPVTVTASNKEVVELFDDGFGADLAADDGIFSAEWTPAGEYKKLTFTSPLGTINLQIKME
jgi:subtilisin family serine protease